MSHTPGPWYVDFEEIVCIRDKDQHSRVCTLNWLRGPHGINGRKLAEEIRANSCLIAAAPTLLSALKMIAGAQKDTIDWEMIDDLVAAAEGRDPTVVTAGKRDV